MTGSFSAEQLIPLLDLTSLNDSDTRETILQCCEQAITPYGNAAAVCVAPQFVACAREALKNSSVQVATVVNFPKGDMPLLDCVAEIRRVLADGANEIDLVMPYSAYLNGETETVFEFIRACRGASAGHALLKVILETGVLAQPRFISEAACLAIKAGADFVKTSTGKATIGVTPEAAEAMLYAIEAFPDKTLGFKASGGVRTVEQALAYVAIAERVMGKGWVSPNTFRLGASSLLQVILASIEL